MPPRLSETSTTATPPHPPHTIQVTYDGEDPLRRGVMSEYDPVYQTPHFSDALCTGLCMLCNSAPPLASMPPHMLPLLVCLFICLYTFVISAHVACLFVCFPFWVVSVN